jgi:hypothetical protein
LDVNDSDEVIDTYFQLISNGIDAKEELDENLSEEIFNNLIQWIS